MTWFNFILKRTEPIAGTNFLNLHGRQIPLAMIRNHRARRYLLRLRPDGSARLTIPRRGSVIEGRRFAERNTEWLGRQLEKLLANPVKPRQWFSGAEILFRGELVRLETGMNGETGTVRFGSERVTVPDANGDLRSRVMNHLWKLATAELPPKVVELAVAPQLKVQRVTIRNQRSRWGSCSRRGTISLNWKLIQAPPFVRDYIILHELMHLRQMSHSPRFWREVEGVCPQYKTAEKWLKEHSSLLK
jgi:predicted metal-dependent hydrolase